MEDGWWMMDDDASFWMIRKPFNKNGGYLVTVTAKRTGG